MIIGNKNGATYILCNRLRKKLEIKNPLLQITQKCQIQIFSNIPNKNLDRKEHQRKNRTQRKITEKITKKHDKLN